MNVSEFLNMGGYALYVWSSYGLALLVLTWIFVMPLFDKKKILQQLRGRYRQMERQGAETGKETENANERK
jgi:heme exporter protein D